MPKRFYSIFLSIILATLFIPSQAIAGRCSGDAYCTACKNCSACKHCSQEGGSCGVCTNYDLPSQEPESEYVAVPPDQGPIIESDPNEYNSDFEDEDIKEEEKSNFGWIWWVIGIGGGLWFFGSLGK